MTLLELLVVLVIASLMLTLVTPNIAKVLPGSELKAFARQSAALLREIRSEAVSQSRVGAVAVDGELQTYRTSNKTSIRWPDGVNVSLDRKNSPLFNTGVAGDRNLLLFFPDGSSSGGWLHIIGESGGAYRIEIDALTGRVSVHSS
ncbi:Tfp pilus assembly protein FimT [Marinobacterium lutimaris]|uniref:Type II secretion system protein H n=2 Tax=Marinobacterium lutimaris TaxID=568106 RepID=A0A1H5X145_9GAMM|nr:Tfp pilus assembly protein FimT [Marinobacterium lutimaris]